MTWGNTVQHHGLRVGNAADQELINHVVFVLDRSTSMRGIAEQVVQVADRQIHHLAQESKEFNQETRATVYQFGDDIECIYYDRDVNRFSSLQGRYQISGMTALHSATLRAIEDLKKTATIYGKHTFLIFVITDGDENASTTEDKRRFRDFMQKLEDEFTVALLVPNERSKQICIAAGYHPNNIQVWETTAKGLEEVSTKLMQTTKSYMSERSVNTSFKGSKSVFDLNPTAVKKELAAGNLVALTAKQYKTYPVKNAPKEASLYDRHGNHKLYIKPYFEYITKGQTYERGTVWYQPCKEIDVQPTKQMLIRDKATRKVYAGDAARKLLKLPGEYCKFSPQNNPDYDVFVESQSDNRILFPNTDIIYYNG